MTVSNINTLNARAQDLTYGHRTLGSAISAISGGIIDEETIILGNLGKMAGDFTIKRSQIRLNNPSSDGDGLSPLTYGPRANTTAHLRIQDNSSIFLNIPDTRANILISEISGNSEIIETTSNKLFVYTQAGAILVNAVFRGISVIEIYRSPSQFQNVSLLNTKIGMLNWEAGRIDRYGVNIPSTTSTWTSWLGNGNSGNNSFYDWNPNTIDQSKIVHGHANNKYFSGFTASYKFIEEETNVPVADALVDLRDSGVDSTAPLTTGITSRGKYTTNVNGILTGFYDSKLRTTSVTSTVQPTLYLHAKKSRQTTGTTNTDIAGGSPSTSLTYVLDSILHYFIIKSYGHHVLPNQTITSEKGATDSMRTVTNYETFHMVADEQLTQKSKSIVDAYTTINNEQELYDRFKSLWRDTDDITPITKTKSGLDLGSYKLRVNDNSLLPAIRINKLNHSITIRTSGTFTVLSKITTTGIIEQRNTAKIIGTVQDSTGVSIEIKTNIPNSKIYYTITSPQANAIITEAFLITNGITGNATITGIDPTATLTLIAKADSYTPVRMTRNIATDISPITITLSKDVNVNSITSITDWVFEDDVYTHFPINNTDIPAPTAIYNHDNKLFVANYSHISGEARIKAYNKDGTRIVQFAGFDLDNENSLSYGITFADNKFWVCDRTDNKIYAYNAVDGSRSASDDFDLDSLNVHVEGITFANNKFWVVNNTSALQKVFVYNLDGSRSASDDFSISITNNPTGITFGNNKLWIIDSSFEKAFVYNLDGTRSTTDDFTLTGSLNSPFGIAFYDNKLWIVDDTNHNVSVYNAVDGTRSTTDDFALNVAVTLVGGITFANGKFAVLSDGKNKVYLYDSNGTEIDPDPFDFTPPSELTTVIKDIATNDRLRYHLTETTLDIYRHASPIRIGTSTVLGTSLNMQNMNSITIIGSTLYILESGNAPKIHIIPINPLNDQPLEQTTYPFITLPLTGRTAKVLYAGLTNDGTLLYVGENVISGGRLTGDATTVFAFDPSIIGADKSVSASNFALSTDNNQGLSMTYDDGKFWILDRQGKIVYSYYADGRGELPQNTMYLEYNAAGKSKLLVGVTNLKNNPVLTKRLFDHIMGTNDGLRWCLNNYQDNGTLLGDIPYIIQVDRIIINESKIEIIKIPKVPVTSHSTFGFTIHQKDYNTAYLPPIKTNGQVEINSLSQFFSVNQGLLQRVLSSETFSDGITTSITNSKSIKEILNDTDNIKEHIQNAPTLPDVGTFEHLDVVDWDGTGVIRTVNPAIPNVKVKTITVNANGALEILFNDHGYTEFFVLNLAGISVPFTLTGNERLYMETDAVFQDATIPIDRLSITPEIDIELFGTVNGRPNTSITRRSVRAEVTLKERGQPKPIKFDFGKLPNSTITSMGIYIKLPSDESNNTRLIMDNFRIFKSVQRDINDYRADVSSIEVKVNKTLKRLTNRRKVNTTTNKIEYYDDDKSTVLETSSLKGSDGTASSTDIFDEVPD